MEHINFLLSLGTFCTHTVLIIISVFFFLSLIHRLKDKRLFLFWFFISHATVWSEIHKMFEDKKLWFRTEM